VFLVGYLAALTTIITSTDKIKITNKTLCHWWSAVIVCYLCICHSIVE